MGLLTSSKSACALAEVLKSAIAISVAQSAFMFISTFIVSKKLARAGIVPTLGRIEGYAQTPAAGATGEECEKCFLLSLT